MKGMLAGLFRYRVFRRLTGSYLLLAVATIAGVSAILFSLFSRSASDEIARNSRELLGHTAYVADILDGQVNAIGSHLINDIDVVSYLYSLETDKLLDYAAMRSLDRITSVYTFIRSIGLYNLVTGGYLNNVGMASRVDLGVPGGSPRGVTPRVIGAEASPDRAAHSVLTYMLYPYSRTGAPERSAIEINIDERYLQTLITSFAGDPADTATMVLDQHGMVLSHVDPAWFMRDVAGMPFARRILSGQQSGGSFFETIDGERRLVSYVRSEASGWSFVMTQVYASLIGDVERLKLITFLVAGCLALLGGVLIVFMTRAVYGPLRRIVESVSGKRQDAAAAGGALDEYALIAETLTRYHETANELRRSLGASIPLMREAYLLGLLGGESREGLIPAALLAELRASLAGTRFMVAVFKLDSFAAFKRDLTPAEQGAARLRAARLVASEMGRIHPCDALIVEEDEIALLLRSTGDFAMDGLVLALAELHRDLLQRTKLSFTCGVGVPSYSVADVHRSYAAAAERCRYRLFFGRGRVIEEGLIHPRRTARTHYPVTVEERILEALKHGDGDLLNRLVGEFVASIEALSYYQVITFTGRLLLAIFWRFGESTELLDENYKDYDRLLREIERSETLGEVIDTVSDFCGKVSALIGVGANRVHVKRNEKIVAEAKRVIAERYTEPGLCLDVVAGMVGLSPGYLAKLFKHVAGQSLGDHLNSVRLERARELLATTGSSAQAIGESVGMYNATYFSTLFKKTYGLSPSRYRDRARAS